LKLQWWSLAWWQGHKCCYTEGARLTLESTESYPQRARAMALEALEALNYLKL